MTPNAVNIWSQQNVGFPVQASSGIAWGIPAKHLKHSRQIPEALRPNTWTCSGILVDRLRRSSILCMFRHSGICPGTPVHYFQVLCIQTYIGQLKGSSTFSFPDSTCVLSCLVALFVRRHILMPNFPCNSPTFLSSFKKTPRLLLSYPSTLSYCFVVLFNIFSKGLPGHSDTMLTATQALSHLTLQTFWPMHSCHFRHH